MKIAESAIAMASDRKSLSIEQFNVTRNVRMKKSALEASKKNKDSLADSLFDDEEEDGEFLKAEGAEVKISRQGQQVSSAFYAGKAEEESDMESEFEAALDTLRMLLKMLRSLGGSKRAIANLERQIEKQSELVKMQKNSSQKTNFSM